MKSKKGSVLVWGIIVLVLIAVGAGIYLWLTGGDTDSTVKIATNVTEKILAQPPAFPSE